MPEHPSDDYLLVNSGIKISRVNCELARKGFEEEFREHEDRRGWVDPASGSRGYRSD